MSICSRHAESSPIAILQKTFGIGPVKKLQALTAQMPGCISRKLFWWVQTFKLPSAPKLSFTSSPQTNVLWRVSKSQNYHCKLLAADPVWSHLQRHKGHAVTVLGCSACVHFAGAAWSQLKFVPSIRQDSHWGNSWNGDATLHWKKWVAWHLIYFPPVDGKQTLEAAFVQIISRASVYIGQR